MATQRCVLEMENYEFSALDFVNGDCLVWPQQIASIMAVSNCRIILENISDNGSTIYQFHRWFSDWIQNRFAFKLVNWKHLIRIHFRRDLGAELLLPEKTTFHLKYSLRFSRHEMALYIDPKCIEPSAYRQFTNKYDHVFISQYDTNTKHKADIVREHQITTESICTIWLKASDPQTALVEST